MSEKDTEQLIKETARKIFLSRGFAATRTRDIAEAADINLALLNYYFRSKKKLYDIIMLETVQSFFAGLIEIFKSETTTLVEKIELLVARYIDMLSANPDMAAFIMNEVRQNPQEFAAKIGFLDQIKGSHFVAQVVEGIQSGKIPPINPIHFLMNITGLVVFPFIAAPMISAVTELPNTAVLEIIQERKRLIPLWINTMLDVT